MRLRGLSSRASPAGKTSVEMMYEPMGMIFFRSAGVASVVYAPLARSTSRAATVPFEVCTRKWRVPLAEVVSTLSTRVSSWRQAPARRAASASPATYRAGFVHHAAEINVRADFAAQLAFGNDAQRVIEFTLDQRGGFFVAIEVRLF